jgi:hypothetical protein
VLNHPFNFSFFPPIIGQRLAGMASAFASANLSDRPIPEVDLANMTKEEIQAMLHETFPTLPKRPPPSKNRWTDDVCLGFHPVASYLGYHHDMGVYHLAKSIEEVDKANSTNWQQSDFRDKNYPSDLTDIFRLLQSMTPELITALIKGTLHFVLQKGTNEGREKMP